MASQVSVVFLGISNDTTNTAMSTPRATVIAWQQAHVHWTPASLMLELSSLCSIMRNTQQQWKQKGTWRDQTHVCM